MRLAPEATEALAAHLTDNGDLDGLFLLGEVEKAANAALSPLVEEWEAAAEAYEPDVPEDQPWADSQEEADHEVAEAYWTCSSALRNLIDYEETPS